jgi:hypothetical protein
MPHTPHRCDPTADSTPADPGVRLIVELIKTADMPDGQPLPPHFDDDAIWRIVRHLPGARTLWRRVRLSSKTSSEHAIDRRLVARTSSAWRQKPRHQNQ